MDFKQKNTARKIFYSPVVVGIVIVLALYALYSTWSIYSKFAQSKRDLDKSQKEMLALAAKNQSLDSQMKDLQTQAGIEKEIRAKFGEALPGESMAVIVEDSPASTSVDVSQTTWWSRFKAFFGL